MREERSLGDSSFDNRRKVVPFTNTRKHRSTFRREDEELCSEYIQFEVLGGDLCGRVLEVMVTL